MRFFFHAKNKIDGMKVNAREKGNFEDRNKPVRWRRGKGNMVQDEEEMVWTEVEMVKAEGCRQRKR